MHAPSELKPLVWIGSSRRDLKSFPGDVQDELGWALRDAQFGGKAINAKVMKGFGGAGVLEIVSAHQGDTYRAVYTVKLEGTVYVLHAFQKKSHKGSETPKHDLDVIRQRLATAQQHHQQRREEA